MPAMPVELPTVGIVPGGGEFGGWSAADPSFLSHQGLKFSFDSRECSEVRCAGHGNSLRTGA